MKGLLKGKHPGNQFLIVIGITLGSFFILGLIGTVLLANMSGIGLSTLSDPSKWNAGDTRIANVIRGMQIIQFVCLFLIPVFICAYFFSTDTSKYLGLKKPFNPWFFVLGTALLLLAIPLTNLVGELNRNVQFPSALEKWMRAEEESAQKTLKILLSKRTVTDLVLNLFLIAGLAAIGEELLFRGLIQRILIRWFKSPWIGIIVSALLFSAMHVQFYGFFPRLILGILLGALYWYSGSLWTAIIAHFVYDAFLIILVYFNPSMLNDESVGTMNTMIVAAMISFVAITAMVWWMKKNSRATFPAAYAEDAIPFKDHPF